MLTAWLTMAYSLAVPDIVNAQGGSCAAMRTGPGASLNGFVPFTAASLWNTDISNATMDPNSNNIIAFIGSATTLHPDFGAGTYDGQTVGIPYQVEPASQAKVAIVLGAYAGESDPGPAPVPANALIEGYPKPGSGDRHVLVLEQSGCWLYEMYNSQYESNGSWKADSAAVWDLLGNETRPYTWTSADAAGLPIFAGLVRYDEVASGAVKHAFRFTLPKTGEAFVLPATHWAATSTAEYAPPMGLRLRLKASYNIADFSAANQVILKALQQYGMILADNGSGIFLTGAPDNRWDNDDLGGLHRVTAADFEVVDSGTVYTPANIPTGPAPAIRTFTASRTTVTPGAAVTLSWTGSGAEYIIVTPSVGPVRGTSTVVKPTETTTYVLTATNRYGRSTKSVKVSVE